jgi:2-(1,2-epoxy-1,2-dihydrophenyl)acetyl-CoA isomerase
MVAGKYTGFEVSVEERVATICFGDGSRHYAISRSAKRDFIEFLHQVQMDKDVRVVVLTGKGRFFIAGDNIASSTMGADANVPTRVPALPYGEETPQLRSYSSLRTLSQMVPRTLRQLDKLTIAAIGGAAIQSGFSIALACDFRIASTTATMGSGTLRMGYLPDEGGHWLLVQHLGVARTMDFLMRKRIVPADQARDLGLVHEVVEAEALAERARALALELAAGPQVAMRLLKRAIYNAADLTLEQACDDIASKTAMADHHPDAGEGRRAFKEKRPPRFN